MLSPTEVPYSDGTATHGLKGTVLPASTARPAQLGEPVAQPQSIGASFALHRPVPHNIVEVFPDGTQRSTPLTADALRVLQDTNRGGGAKSINYYEAIQLAKKPPAPVVPAPEPFSVGPSLSKETAVEVPAGPALPMEEEAASGPAPELPDDSEDFTPVLPAVVRKAVRAGTPGAAPKIRVTFHGSFGRLTIPVTEVHQDTQRQELLILRQDNADGQHYEAPESDEPIRITIGQSVMVCYYGVQFATRDRRTHFVVLVLDAAKTQELRDGSKK